MLELLDFMKNWLPQPENHNFKTPKELGVTKKQFCALMQVAEGLQSGRLQHYRRGMKIKGKLFSMNTWAYKGGCGSVCCIGGWAQTVGRVSFGASRGSRPPGLQNLFFPKGIGEDWDRITPTQAARAITNWARTGDPQWKRATRHG